MFLTSSIAHELKIWITILSILFHNLVFLFVIVFFFCGRSKFFDFPHARSVGIRTFDARWNWLHQFSRAINATEFDALPAFGWLPISKWLHYIYNFFFGWLLLLFSFGDVRPCKNSSRWRGIWSSGWIESCVNIYVGSNAPPTKWMHSQWVSECIFSACESILGKCLRAVSW